MYQRERMDKITEILKIHGYVTVKFLTEALHYSTATVNRDLNIMEKQNLVHRTYGGVELIERKSVPLPFRYHKMKTAKAKLGKVAADLVHDGDTVFIDATTTTEFISKHLTDKKDITVITNNVAVVTYLSEYGIKVICLGGNVVEPPYMLSGDVTVENAMRYNADKMFFSTGGISESGMICYSGVYALLHKTMAKNSDKVYFVVDHEKVGVGFKMNLFDLSHVDGIITDYQFSDEIKSKFKDTKFIEVK